MSNERGRWLTSWLLVAYVLAGCGSSSDGSPTGGSSGASVAGNGGSEASGSGGHGGAAGSSSTNASGNGGNPAGTAGTAGALTHADAVSAIQAGCASAMKQCPGLDTAKCEAQSEATLPAEGARCFQPYAAFVQCVSKAPASAIQCSGDEAFFSASLCSTERGAVTACTSADTGA